VNGKNWIVEQYFSSWILPLVIEKCNCPVHGIMTEKERCAVAREAAGGKRV
jgi:hypothetical protein